MPLARWRRAPARTRARNSAGLRAHVPSASSVYRDWEKAKTSSSSSRGGEANGPASVYAVAKWDEWLRKYAPPGAASYDFYQSLPALSQGNVAQQIFWYTAFTADMVKEGLPVMNEDGTPKWRMAPSPRLL